MGGTKLYATDTTPFIGSKSAYVLDTEVGWTRLADMVFGRWYPSAIMLPDGRVLVLSGASDDGGITPRVEIYNPLSGWELLPESADRLLPLYPRLHVLPSGEVACLGNGTDLIFFNPDTQEWRDLGAAGAIPNNDDDLAVLLAPAQTPKILHAGGSIGAADGDPGSAAAQIIDLTVAAPAWRDIAPMANRRWFLNTALLPDGTLFVVGGGRVHGADPVMEPEIFDPVTETWRTDVPMSVPRLYHSTALLLPDGRVWVAGTDGETRMEVYTPDYLLRGPRPVITDAPASLAYGQSFPLHLEAGDISSVAFIRLSAVTHCFNMGQRSVALHFAPGDPDGFQITAPADANLAPPGYYMLFVLDPNGVPAVAPIIQLVAV